MKIIKSFTHDEKTINVYGTFEEPLFLAKEIGEHLGLNKIRTTISNMDPDWKVAQTLGTLGGAQKMTFLKEPGLYYLLMRSSKEEAKPFQKWVVGEVLPTIRKTGKYEMENNTKQIKDRTVFKIETEYDLHSKVVHFIKCRFPNAVLLATLGELQDTDKKRIESYNMGYQTGSCDIFILNPSKHHQGLSIEFKSPTGKGVVSESQDKFISKMKSNTNFKVIVSNNYDDIIIELVEYFRNVMIKCTYCSGKFKNEQTLKNHCKHFHRIN